MAKAKQPKTKEEKKLDRKQKADAIKKEFLRQCEIAGLPIPETEYKFHPTRKWRLDYYFPTLKLGVEQEGGLWVVGRHNRPKSMIADMEKYNEVALAQITLLRFTPQQITDGTAVSKIMLFSMLDPVVISKNNLVISGQHRVNILKQLGLKKIHVQKENKKELLHIDCLDKSCTIC